METCIICHEEDGAETFMDPSPCACKGTIRIHKTCYKEIRNRFGVCPICKMAWPIEYIDGLASMIRFEDGFKIVYKINESGKKHGPEVTWCSDEGQLHNKKVEEVVWTNGVKQGIARAWYHSGAIEALRGWHNNQQHGIELHWHENGKQAFELHWNHGKKHGIQLEWREDGTQKYYCEWRNGLRHGVEKVYDETGFQILETMWNCDDIHGDQHIWLEHGTFHKKVEWVRGLRHGLEICWANDNEKPIYINEWKNGENLKMIKGKRAWRMLEL